MRLAERYVKLVLALGQHDADYVDAYYGPPSGGRRRSASSGRSREIDTRRGGPAAVAGRSGTDRLQAEETASVSGTRYLTRQLGALRTRVAMLTGRKLTFDEESKALYDAVAPTNDASESSRSVLAELGSASARDRVRCWSATTRSAAGSSSRAIASMRRSRRRSTDAAAGRCSTSRCRPARASPSSTSPNKSWSGYNWYQGNYRSLIQVNTDLPIYVDRAIDLACHEGYPGHHVYNVLLEKNLVRDRGWVEFSVYPLFSPQSLIAEGTANYGIDVAFPAGIGWRSSAA